jgi:hypothetical protein
MLTDLLTPRGASTVGQTQKIEVVDDEAGDDEAGDDEAGDDDIDDNDEQWYYKQEIPSDKGDFSVALDAEEQEGKILNIVPVLKLARFC